MRLFRSHWLSSIALHLMIVAVLVAASVLRASDTPHAPPTLAIEATVITGAMPKRAAVAPPPPVVHESEAKVREALSETSRAVAPATPRAVVPVTPPTVMRPAPPPPITTKHLAALPPPKLPAAAASPPSAESARDVAMQRARDAELRRLLAAEERTESLRSSGVEAQWKAAVIARIQQEWRLPPTARAGVRCTVMVTQVPGGTVVDAQIASCNGDTSVRESVLAAAYRASPLPTPPDAALFQRTLEVEFNPKD